MIDTLRQVMYAYDYQIETGEISNRRIHIQFEENEFPDGMCIDSDGGFWVAMWGGSKVIHFDKNGLKMLDINMPVSHPTSCCFGGKDMKTLFITSSKLPLTDVEKKQYPMAGKTFKVETETIGQQQLQYHG